MVASHPPSMAAMADNSLLATAFWPVLRRLPETNRKVSYWQTTGCCSGPYSSVAVHVNRSSFKKIKICSLSSKDDYQLEELRAFDDGGPPRWFSPVECGCRSKSSPLLLFLPGIDGVGLGLMSQYKRLGEIFDIWCLHIPVADRTPLTDLVKLVQSTVRSEHNRVAKRPIYLVGESVGASLALVVAAENPDIDLVLILANPATSLCKSLMQSVAPLSDMIHKHRATSSISETIVWKLKMIHKMQNHLKSLHLHTVKAQTLILKSGKNNNLPSEVTESDVLDRINLQRCQIRSYAGKGNPLFSDDTFDLVAAIKRVFYYRRGASVDYISDFIPPTPSEFEMNYESFRWMDVALNPVMFSTLDNGEVVQGLTGIPSQGPVLFVGNHMMMGLELIPLLSRLWTDRNIIARGMAHPTCFERFNDGKVPDLLAYDSLKVLGTVPVSPTNLHRLLSLKSHVLLYPGGAREALHRKGEEYKLFWPVEPEFVRMAARFGAKIVPFGGVGEDDLFHLLLDYDDQMKIPPLKAYIEELTKTTVTLRNHVEGEVGKQIPHYPLVLPKLPGRLYVLFGKPISTEGMEDILTKKDRANEMYLEVQHQIYECIAYLKKKREKDPYRNLLARLAYQCFNGFDSQVPTFDI